MTTRTISLQLLFSAALFLFAAALPASAGDSPEAAADVADKAGEIIKRMELRTADSVWDLVPHLEDLGEPALGRIEEGLESESPVVRLACAKVLYNLGFGDPEPLAAMLRAGREPFASMAAGILGQFGEKDEAEILAEALGTDLPVSARIEVARSLAGLGDDREKAVRFLQETLRSDDAGTAESAALCLSEIGEGSLAEGILGSLKAEPSMRGRLSRSLSRRRELEQALKALSGPKGNPVEEVRDLVKANYLDESAFYSGKPRAIDEGFLRDAAALGIARSLDPFCDYLTEEQYKDDRQRARGSYAGIGAFVVMREYIEEGAEPPPPWEETKTVITVDRPIYADPAPAYKRGVRSGDQIVAYFDEEMKDWVSLVGWNLDQCVDKLKGPVGTRVRIKVKRHGHKEFIELEPIQRQEIVVNVALGKLLPGNIGYILLRRFDNKSSKDFERTLNVLEKKGLQGLVLDLRGNPGGTMREVVNIIDSFLDTNLLITYTKGEVEDWTQLYFSRHKPHPPYPVVILIRKDSASGSEMLAGALKAHGRAVIVGETSFGKGSGQTLLPLKKAAPKRWIRLTIFKYYLPDETSIHGKGVKPDVFQEPDRYESWQYDWQIHLSRTGLIEDYVARQYDRNKVDLFKLAEYDGLSSKDYPEFDSLFQQAVRVLYHARMKWTRSENPPSFEEFLAQHSNPEDRSFVRQMMRSFLRRRVQDDRAQPFIQDFQEDVQLQRAIFEILKQLGRSPAEVPEYKHFVGKFD